MIIIQFVEIGINISKIYNESVLNNNNIKYETLWLRYPFASLEREGLTATRPIIDPNTGQVMAIASVDFTLNELCYIT